ncbi:hypothetical protein D3C71_1992740 [compost metagenome]
MLLGEVTQLDGLSKNDLTLIRREPACNQIQQCRLPAAVRTNDPYTVTRYRNVG